MFNVSFRVQTIIKAAPEAIFPLLADLTRHGEWSANPVQIEAVTKGTPQVGSVYRSAAQVNNLHFSAELTVNEYQPPLSFAFTGKDETGIFKHQFRLSPEPNGTRVERRVSFELSFRQWLMYCLLLFPVRLPAAQKALRRLKEYVEAGQP